MPKNKPDPNQLFKEHYERLDLEELLKQGREHIEGNTHFQAINWNNRFWNVTKVLVLVAILGICGVYGYVIYKVKIYADQYEKQQVINYKKALGEPNE